MKTILLLFLLLPQQAQPAHRLRLSADIGARNGPEGLTIAISGYTMAVPGETFMGASPLTVTSTRPRDEVDPPVTVTTTGWYSLEPAGPGYRRMVGPWFATHGSYATAVLPWATADRKFYPAIYWHDVEASITYVYRAASFPFIRSYTARSKATIWLLTDAEGNPHEFVQVNERPD